MHYFDDAKQTRQNVLSIHWFRSEERNMLSGIHRTLNNRVQRTPPRICPPCAHHACNVLSELEQTCSSSTSTVPQNLQDFSCVLYLHAAFHTDLHSYCLKSITQVEYWIIMDIENEAEHQKNVRSIVYIKVQCSSYLHLCSIFAP